MPLGKVIITGASGFLARALHRFLSRKNYEVILVGRNTQINWDTPETLKAALENAIAVINLAGKSVNCRYNSKNKAEIFRSRTATTSLLGDLIQQCQNPPKVWINSSTGTIYRHADDRPMTEDNGEIGTGFSVDVAKAWEATFFESQLPTVKKVALRLSIVLGTGGGVMVPYKRLTCLGLGGQQGNGTQMFSLIHIDDVCKIILQCIENPAYQGILNVATPNAITNAAFSKALIKRYRPLFALPASTWMLKLGAIIIGTETELILKSRWVYPEKLLQLGYTFKYPTIDECLASL